MHFFQKSEFNSKIYWPKMRDSVSAIDQSLSDAHLILDTYIYGPEIFFSDTL